MKSKHLTGDAYPLTLHEMLEECAQNQTVSKSMMLCMTVILCNVLKLEKLNFKQGSSHYEDCLRFMHKTIANINFY